MFKLAKRMECFLIQVIAVPLPPPPNANLYFMFANAYSSYYLICLVSLKFVTSFPLSFHLGSCVNRGSFVSYHLL